MSIQVCPLYIKLINVTVYYFIYWKNILHTSLLGLHMTHVGPYHTNTHTQTDTHTHIGLAGVQHWRDVMRPPTSQRCQQLGVGCHAYVGTSAMVSSHCRFSYCCHSTNSQCTNHQVSKVLFFYVLEVPDKLRLCFWMYFYIINALSCFNGLWLQWIVECTKHKPLNSGGMDHVHVVKHLLKGYSSNLVWKFQKLKTGRLKKSKNREGAQFSRR